MKTPIAKRLALIAKARKARTAAKEAETGARSKFDLGSRARELAVEHIPWGYNHDRITAMFVDPRRMYAYWEVRDEAIEEARGALGRGGKDAWLNLRVYDITGRIFDGTNAHRYFDVKVERSDRQWFLDIGRPTSCHCVEIGVKSFEGYFRKIARSGGVEFPRAEPGAPGPIEWLSVHAIAGEVGAPVPGAPRPAAQLPSTAPHRPALPAHEHGPGAWAEGEYWIVNEPGALPGWAIISGWESHDFTNTEWIGGHGHLAWAEGGQRFEWVGPVVRTTWEAGPFPIPVEAPGLVEERYEGPVLVQKIGDRTRIVYGPWNVVIRGIGGRAEARVLARWEVRKSWITDTGFEVTGGTLRWAAPRVAEGQPRAPGASEGRLGGASERHWLAGSEVRLAGASEIFRVGASEIHYLGASETMFLAASETRYRGASERRWPAASETLARGASEQWFPGASERARGGASQQPHAGASERRPGAGSETRYPEASGKGPRPKGRRPAPRGRARAK